MAKIATPRYMIAQRRADGGTAYYWQRPSWAKPPAERFGRLCPVEAESLGRDLAAAIAKAEMLNRQFEEWRIGLECKPAEGTVKALLAWYRTQPRFADLGPRAARDYRHYMGRIEAFPLKSTTLGARRAAEIEAHHADAIYRAVSKRDGKRAAAYWMQILRRVWNEAIRHKKLKGPNPFAKMGISMVAAKGNRATSRAEYNRFREQARAMGFQSMATAAALSFELVRRVSDVFGYLFDRKEEDAPTIAWEEYQPGAEIALRQGKTGDAQIIPLADEEGRPFYPALEEELARMERGTGHIVIYEKTGQRFTEQQSIKLFNKIRDAAGLPGGRGGMTLTGFRHGGATELGDAGVEDIRSISGHRTLGQTATYNKATKTKARKAGARRREHVEAKNPMREHARIPKVESTN